jgi:hypothetical protein
VGHVASKEEKRNAYRITIGKCVGKRLLGAATTRVKNDIKINFQK